MDLPSLPSITGLSPSEIEASLERAAATAQAEAFARVASSPAEWLCHLTAEDRADALSSRMGHPDSAIEHEHAEATMRSDFGSYVGETTRGPMLFEVRAAAIEYLQAQALLGHLEWRWESLSVARPRPLQEILEEARTGLAELTEGAAREIREQAEFDVWTRARPRLGEGEGEIAYRVMQLLGLTKADEQPVCPHTLLTPLLEELHRSNLASERPAPHLVVSHVDRDDLTLGYVLMDGEGPVLDFASTPVARVAESRVARCFEPGGGVLRADGVTLVSDPGSPAELLEALSERLAGYRTRVTL